MADLHPNNDNSDYAQWRARVLLRDAFQETPEPSAPGLPSERLLQKIWSHQRLLRDQLKTLDGAPVKVLHPGFWNNQAGPDFQNAILQIGPASPAAGDVEIDLCQHHWRAHRHEGNPNYDRVLLHVIWRPEPLTPSSRPVLALQPHLDAPLAEIALSFAADAALPLSWLAGECCAPLQNLPPETLRQIILQAARARLETKAAYFQARARQAGWDQCLWEGLLAGLGYKHNIWPMRRIAELLPSLTPAPPQLLSPKTWQSRLLGLGGLLPHDLPRSRASANDYTRDLWDSWWRERESFSEALLPPQLWRLHGLRPANHPQRRLALASHWLASGDLVARLERWFNQSENVRTARHSLLQCLQVEQDPFWSLHWTFKSKPMARPQPLLGGQRLTDLAINTILPWFWIRADAGKNRDLRARAERLYFDWPKSEDNAILRLARLRLFARGNAPREITAAQQQGLLQIVRDFCDHSNALCDNCPFPELVRRMNSEH